MEKGKMSKITYHIGDVFKAIKDFKNKDIIVPHVCNDIGTWGAGFVIPLAEHFPRAKNSYLSKIDYKLGHVDFVPIHQEKANNKISICNMIAQLGTVSEVNSKPIKYWALAKCLKFINVINSLENAEIHTCAFGTGLAGGDWKVIAELLKETFPGPINIYCLTREQKQYLVKRENA